LTRRGRLSFAAAAAACFALTATVAVSASAPQSHAMRQRGAGNHASSSGNLIDHGGPVMPVSTTYAIWWGNQGAWSSDVKSGVGSFFGGLNGSSYLNDIATQYMRNSSVSTVFAGSNNNKQDTSNPPKNNPSTSTIMNEVLKEYPTPSSGAIYFVFTSNFPRGVNYCAWHSWGTTSKGVHIQFAYMPNTGGVAGCDPGNTYGSPADSQDLRSLVNVTSHEYMETLTDAQGTAWYDSGGSEIGDKCAWQFSGPVVLGGHTWQLQEEWSNRNSGCIQS